MPFKSAFYLPTEQWALRMIRKMMPVVWVQNFYSLWTPESCSPGIFGQTKGWSTVRWEPCLIFYGTRRLEIHSKQSKLFCWSDSPFSKDVQASTSKLWTQFWFHFTRINGTTTASCVPGLSILSSRLSLFRCTRVKDLLFHRGCWFISKLIQF